MRRLLSSARGIIAAGVAAPLAAACIPYSVITTAEPAPRGERQTTLAVSAMPSVSLLDSTRGTNFTIVEGVTRIGLDSVSDVGFRAGGGGITMSYKRLLTRRDEPALIAIMPGFGFVNMAQHAHFELTVLASRRSSPDRPGGRERTIVPYGGLRIMQVAPLHEDAVHDRPTAGGFVGVRLGRPTFGVSPEVGIFYDHSALGVRESNVVVVPTLAFHGDELIDLIRNLPRGGVFTLARRPSADRERILRSCPSIRSSRSDRTNRATWGGSCTGTACCTSRSTAGTSGSRPW